MLKTFARAQGVTGQRVCVCVLDWAATRSDTHTHAKSCSLQKSGSPTHTQKSGSPTHTQKGVAA